MTINHRAEAVRLAEESHSILRPNDEGHCEADRLLAEAQVHATLARGEADAASQANARDALTLLRRREYATRELVSTHIAKGLGSREPDRWKAALDLAKGLDEADANMDQLIDDRLADDGWDPRGAWKTPAAFTAPADDPWAAAPGPVVPGQPYSETVETAIRNLSAAGYVTPADTLIAASAVIAGHVAEALTDGKNNDIRLWAMGITAELRRAGLDLRGAIERRAEDLKPGTPFSYDAEPPF